MAERGHFSGMRILLLLIVVMLVFFVGFNVMVAEVDEPFDSRYAEDIADPPEESLEFGLPEEKVDSELKLSEADSLHVVVTLSAAEDKQKAAKFVEGFGGKVCRGLDEEGRALELEISVAALEELAARPEVIYLEPLAEYRLLNDRAREITGALPLNVTGFLPEGLTGAGQIIGISDSGLDIGSMEDIHPDLSSTPGKMPKVVMLKSWAGSDSAADPLGHGTHVAATVAGTGAASGGKYRGIAPGASIYFQALLAEDGKIAPPLDLIALFRPAYEAGVRVHLNAWGGEGKGYLSHASQIDGFVRGHPDFLVVFGAGNDGPSEGTLTAEANNKNGLVVGASQNPRPALDLDQADAAKEALFSSRGLTQDGRWKPDLLAPGTLVSSSSRLVDGNFQPNKNYSCREGTSMAAAVAAGSAALLRDYLKKYQDLAAPSAALLKAALINGARTAETGKTGVLDLVGTVLSFEEGLFHFVEGSQGVESGESISFDYKVAASSSPLKVALAWTDPPAAPGSKEVLVNNLDLVVQDPQGKEYRSNNDKSNIEQVIIADPMPGDYLITVRGKEIARDVVSGAASNNQDFALVFGQPLCRGVVSGAGAEQGKLVLASGQELNADLAASKLVRNGLCLDIAEIAGNPSACRRFLGGDVYYAPLSGSQKQPVYIVSKSWQEEGVQILSTSQGTLFSEINPEVREGGYFLNPSSDEDLLVNDSPAADLAAVPPGGEVIAQINPSSQTIWQASVSFREVEGFLDGVDPERREIYLIGQDTPYSISSEAAITSRDALAGVALGDLPFGAPASPDWNLLLPGLRVELVCSPQSDEVLYLGVKRRLAVGTIGLIDLQKGMIELKNGSSYEVQPGITVTLDGKASSLEDLTPGTHISALLFPDDEEILALAAYSSLNYGQVIYANNGEGRLYFLDEKGCFSEYRINSETEVFRWGLPGDPELIEPGCWARLYLDPATGQPARIDLAEAWPEKTELLLDVDASEGEVVTGGGNYLCNEHTLVTKNGRLVGLEELEPGENVKITPLLASVKGRSLLAAVSAGTASLPAVEGFRDMEGHWAEEDVNRLAARQIISGYPDGSFRPQKAISRAEFIVLLGKAFDWDVKAGAAAVFTDWNLIPSWAKEAVARAAAEGIIRGYGDGSFAPQNPLTRAETAVILAAVLQAENQPLEGTGNPAWSDRQLIPSWAKESAVLVWQEKIMQGYSSGLFAPQETLKRAEAARVVNSLIAGLSS